MHVFVLYKLREIGNHYYNLDNSFFVI